MSSGGPQSAVHILLVEDNPADARLLTTLLKNSQIPFNIEVVTDGEEATRYLTQKGTHSTTPVPDVVLLDINLPKKDGFEVLAEIRQDARVADIPVIIISSSKNPEDVLRGQALNAAGFYAKPSDILDYEKLAETLIQEVFPRALPKRLAAFTKKAPATPLAGAESEGPQSDELFRQIVEAVKEYAIFMLNSRGNILTWNEGAERVKGYKGSEVIGKHFSIFYTKEALEKNHPQYELEVAKREGVYEEEGLRVRRDGSTFWANVVITALHDKDGVLQGFAKVTRDVTEKRKADDARRKFSEELERKVKERTEELEQSRKELMEQRDQLTRSNTDLQQFAYVASHDLQEPLRGIITCHQLLEKRYAKNITPEMQEYMSIAVESSQRMKALIEGLLQYGRVGQVSLTGNPVDFNQVAQDAVALLKPVIDETGAKITIGNLPSLQADGALVTHVFKNLISNAIKYRGDKSPVIDVNAEKKGATWNFTVKDNGMGIESKYFDRIFVIFQRLHSDRRKYPGTGIGLAVCKRIIEAHGGNISLESKPGAGTTFRFTLPA